MEIIGRIEYQRSVDDLGKALSDSEFEYRGGLIVKLTRREVEALRRLQEAIRGNGYNFARLNETIPADCHMDETFRAIAAVVDSQFAVNDLTAMVETLKNRLLEVKTDG